MSMRQSSAKAATASGSGQGSVAGGKGGPPNSHRWARPPARASRVAARARAAPASAPSRASSPLHSRPKRPHEAVRPVLLAAERMLRPQQPLMVFRLLCNVVRKMDSRVVSF